MKAMKIRQPSVVQGRIGQKALVKDTRMYVCVRVVGTRNIYISDEAYTRLAALKRPRESFTDVINRLAGKRSILDLAGVLSSKEEVELRSGTREIRTKSRRRLNGTTRRIKRSS